MALQAMLDQNQIPCPSIIASSGRGMYVYWLLEQSDINDRETINLYDEVQVQIYETLKDLGADFKAKDASRVLRLPGSYHLKARQRVCYSACENSQGVIPRFNLVELANMFPSSDRRMAQSKKMLNSGISCKLSEAISKGALPPGCLFPKNLPTADSAVKKVALAHIRELCTIAEKRGGIKKGCRHNFLWIYANRLYVLGVPIEGLAEYLLEMNAYGCDPPLESKDVFYASSGVKRYLSNHSGRICQRNSCSIAQELHITTKEVEQYDLKYIIHSEVRSRRKCENTERIMRHVMERMEKQRLMVKMIEQSEKEGVIMGRSELAKPLGVAPQTITNWKRLMKIPINPRGRPKLSQNSMT